MRILSQQNAQLGEFVREEAAKSLEKEAEREFIGRTPTYDERKVEAAYYELPAAQRYEYDGMPKGLAKRLIWAERVAPTLQAPQPQPTPAPCGPAPVATPTAPPAGEASTPYTEPATPVPPSGTPVMPENVGLHSTRADLVAMMNVADAAGAERKEPGS